MPTPLVSLEGLPSRCPRPPRASLPPARPARSRCPGRRRAFLAVHPPSRRGCSSTVVTGLGRPDLRPHGQASAICCRPTSLSLETLVRARAAARPESQRTGVLAGLITCRRCAVQLRVGAHPARGRPATSLPFTSTAGRRHPAAGSGRGRPPRRRRPTWGPAGWRRRRSPAEEHAALASIQQPVLALISAPWERARRRTDLPNWSMTQSPSASVAVVAGWGGARAAG